jgi:tetratricopeptide (TPR) repeat protein
VAALALRQEDFSAIQAAAEQALPVAREIGDQRMIAQALTHLGQAAAARGEAQVAIELLSEACAGAAAAGEAFWEATSLAELGRLAAAAGDLDRAAERLEASRARFAEIGHQWGLALALLSLGVVRSHQRRLEAAQQHVRQALGLFEALGERGGALASFEALVVIRLHQGQAGACARLLGAVDWLREVTGFTPWGSTYAELEAARTTAVAALGEAVFEAEWNTGRATCQLPRSLETTSIVPVIPSALCSEQM